MGSSAAAVESTPRTKLVRGVAENMHAQCRVKRRALPVPFSGQTCFLASLYSKALDTRSSSRSCSLRLVPEGGHNAPDAEHHTRCMMHLGRVNTVQ